MNDDLITKASEHVKKSAGDKSIQEAVNMLLENFVKAGDKVAIINDPTYPCEGVTGKVKGVSAKGSGFVDVELPNGTVVPLQSSLLVTL